MDTTKSVEMSSVDKGKLIFHQCAICHSLLPNKNRIGPSLYKIVNKSIAAQNNFHYSQAMLDYAKKHNIWDKQTLYIYLASPQKQIPGTIMSFAGLSSKEDRNVLIQYLQSVDK